jgi:hypothetical protein
MSQQSIVYLIAAIFFGAGVLVIVISRPVARGYAWLETIIYSRFPFFKKLSSPYGEKLTRTIMVILGVAFMVISPLALVLGFALLNR